MTPIFCIIIHVPATLFLIHVFLKTMSAFVCTKNRTCMCQSRLHEGAQPTICTCAPLRLQLGPLEAPIAPVA